MSKKAKIISIMVVKNEVDIVTDVIESALLWSDYIIYMDNGSTDGTAEALYELSKKNSRLIFWGTYNGRFHDALRQRIFKDYEYLANYGDWWCRLDADEIYIDNPKEIISRVNDEADYINSASFQYYITEKEWLNKITYKDLSYYSCNWSECRFFKYKKGVFWPDFSSWPINIFNNHSVHIRLKHYQYRNIKQMKIRSAIRSENTNDNSIFKHDKASGEKWYKHRGFDVPDNKEMVLSKIVMSRELNSNTSYSVPNDFIIKFPLKKGVKHKIKKALFSSFFYFYSFFSRLYTKHS